MKKIKETDVKQAYELATQQKQNAQFSYAKATILKNGALKMYEKWRLENKGKIIKFTNKNKGGN